MVNDDIWVPTPDELDAEVEAERERRGARRSGVRSASAGRPDTTADSSGPAGRRRTLRIGGDVTRQGGAEGSEQEYGG
jgi:hypothetical protein